MGAKLCSLFKSKKKAKILMFGLDGAGKTSILYQLKLSKFINTSQTIGFNYETIKYKGLFLEIWDIGGNNIFFDDKCKCTVLCKHYFQNTDGLIFVVDSNDRDRIEDAAEELKKMLAEEELKDCAVLVMANKQDLNGALSPNDVTDKMGMGQLKGRSWLVQGTSATTGQGLKEGLDWMAGVLLKKK